MSREDRETLGRICALLINKQIIRGLEISEERPIGKAILWASQRLALLEEVAEKAKVISLWRSPDDYFEIPIFDLCAALRALEEKEEGRCDHSWVSARNEVVSSGEICIKCNAVRPEEKEEGDDGSRR